MSENCCFKMFHYFSIEQRKTQKIEIKNQVMFLSEFTDTASAKNSFSKMLLMN